MPDRSEVLKHLRIGSTDQMRQALTRSHLADGRVVGWFGDSGHVIDAEIVDQPVPPLLGIRHGTDDFWVRWTRAECAAKAADVPIAVWLADHGLPADLPGVTVEIDGVVISIL